jgi:hypothetical protein
VCAACGHDLDRDEYSNNQWRFGVGNSRCKLCVTEGIRSSDSRFNTARENESSKSVLYMNELVGEGAFRNVVPGEYTSGHRRGQQCVGKFFKSGAVFEDIFFEQDIRAVDKALDIITSWNQAGIINKQIRLNKPGVWHMTDRDSEYYGQRLLIEPYIEDYIKFNSNTGWTSRDGGQWNKIMQALSHYSYHVSSGQYLLCDLQGGIYRDGAILSDPVIHSRRRDFGVTDLGPEGMSTFFSRHRCNEFCNQSWTRPKDRNAYYQVQSGSTMELPPGGYAVNTRTSLAPMSGIQESYSSYSDEDDW